MFRARSNQNTVGGLPDDLDEFECGFEICRWIEDFRMGYDTHKTAKYKISHRKGFRCAQELLQPSSVSAVPRSILPMCVNENIHIKELHS
jgi:hypothetical protein